MKRTRYLIGIDLGTTNSSLAYIDTQAKGKKKSTLQVFSPSQLVKPGKIAQQQTLPSCVYFPGDYDLTQESYALPWDSNRQYIVGELARHQGRLVPARLVHSSKSWLCHSEVDRRAPILPWGASEEIPKISPVEAASYYLNFFKESWNFNHAQNPSENLENQEIVLTVPASFDEVARELTLEAARNSGFHKLMLLEEPMAAFYYWISCYEKEWPKKVAEQMLALVIDIGGGTTDFSLIDIQKHHNEFSFSRVAVGNHLLLGGDNMDMALAHYLEQSTSRKLDSLLFSQLIGQCSEAKEKLWHKKGPEQHSFTIAGRGSSVIGKSQKFTLTQADLQKIILDGFFPEISWQEPSKAPARVGLREWGLPYEKEPAITRHLQDFLKQHLPPKRVPNLILFNGGALTPRILRQRLQNQLGKWFQEQGVKKFRPLLLHNSKLNLAVALGASYYHLVKAGQGIRIAAGNPRSYYLKVAIEQQRTAKALCVLPYNAQTGEKFVIDQHPLEARAGEAVVFSLFSSTTRKHDRAGDIVDVDPQEMQELPALETTLEVGKKAKRSQIPIILELQYTEIGTLEVWLLDRDSDRKWPVHFQTRSTPTKTPHQQAAAKKKLPFPTQKVQNLIKETFQGDNNPEKLAKELEKLLDKRRNAWDLLSNRQIWDILIAHENAREKTPEHEARWLNLAGFCLRPGLGHPDDSKRIKKIWAALVHSKLHHEKSVPCWLEWWILWRRIAGGLKAAQQLDVFRQMGNHLLPANSAWRTRRSQRGYARSQEKLEMWRTAGSLEYLPEKLRLELGDSLSEQLQQQNLEPAQWWAWGRIASRELLYAPKNQVIPGQKILPWLGKLLELSQDSIEFAYALAQMVRHTGDRLIDVPEKYREQAIAKFSSPALVEKQPQLKEIVLGNTAMQADLQKYYFGDTLPEGLILKTSES